MAKNGRHMHACMHATTMMNIRESLLKFCTSLGPNCSEEKLHLTNWKYTFEKADLAISLYKLRYVYAYMNPRETAKVHSA